MKTLMNIISLLFLFGCNYQMSKKDLGTQVTANLTRDDTQKMDEIAKMFEGYSRDFPTAFNIAPKEALNLEKTVFIDVREPKEMRISMLPGAITQKEFEDHKEKYLRSNLVIYCTIGYRSGLFTEQISNEGFTAYNLKGGVLSWSHDRLGFYNGDQRTNKIHVYGSKWNLAHSEYDTTY